MINLKKLAAATGGTLVIAETGSDPITTLAVELGGFFKMGKPERDESRDIAEVTGNSDRIHVNCILRMGKGLEVTAIAKLGGPCKMQLHLVYTSISKSDFGDLTDALIKFHETVSAFIAVSPLKGV